MIIKFFFVMLAATIVLLAYAAFAKTRGGAKPGQSKAAAAEGGRASKEDTRLAYRYHHNNLFVHGKSLWMGVRLSPRGSNHMSLDELATAVRQAAQAFTTLGSNRAKTNLQYRMTTIPVDVDQWAEQLLENAWDPSDMYRNYVGSQEHFLMATGASEPAPVLFVELAELEESTLERVAANLDSMIIGTHDDALPPDIAATWNARARQVMGQLRSLGDATSELTPLTRSELLWLIRKPLSGHFAPSLDDLTESKPWGDGEFSQWVDLDADNERNHIVIKLLNDDVAAFQRDLSQPLRRSYTACLLLTDAPQASGITSPGLFEFLSSAGCEVSYRATIISRESVKHQVKKIKDNIDGELKSVERGGRHPDQLLSEEVDAAKDAYNEVRRADGPTGLTYQLIAQVSAPTLEALSALCDRIKADAKEAYGVTLTRVRRGQWRLLMTMLPGSGDPRGVTMGVRLSDVVNPALAHPRVGTRIGNRVEISHGGRTKGWRGDFIGFAEDVAVFDSPHASIARGAPPGVLIVGVAGGGKTNYALLKFFQDTESGVKGFVIDPKNDFAKFVYYMSFGAQVNDPDFDAEAEAATLGTPGSKFKPINPQFWAETLVVDVVMSRAGLLDSWQIARGDLDAGAQIAREVFSIALRPDVYEQARPNLTLAMKELENDCIARRSEYRAAHPEASEAEVALAVKPSMWAVVQRTIDRCNDMADRIADSDPMQESQLRATAVDLESLLKANGSRVMFAETPSSINMDGYRRLVFTLLGIQRPKQGQSADRWGEGERFGAAVIYLLTHMISTQMGGQKKRHRTTGLPTYAPCSVWVDESYIITAFEAGRDFLKTLLAQGRSLNFALYLLDQNASRVAKIEQNEGEDSESSGNQLQSIFAFKQRKGQAEVAASMMSVNNAAHVAGSILSVGEGGDLTTGRCMMRDIDSGLALLDVELMHREFLDACDTNANSRAESQSHDISPDPLDWHYLGSDERELALERGELATLEEELSETNQEAA